MNDRRHPPQAEIMALMIELGGITQAAREELKAFREEREAWRDDIAELKAALKARGIASDPMGTGAAVRTYNIMLAEQRAVAAALIAV